MFEYPEKPYLSDEELEKLTKEEFNIKYKQLKNYAQSLEEKDKKNLFELAKLKNIILMNYVSSKELESNNQFQDVTTSSNSNQLNLSQNQTNKTKQTLVDPTINAIIIQLKKELEDTRKKKEELQLELNSTKFTPESQLTKRLMAKCRKLLNENEELGKIISSGNVAQLEHDLAYHKQLLNETCENEQNLNSFLFEMDNQMDAMQATILKLKERLSEKELANSNEIKNEKMET